MSSTPFVSASTETISSKCYICNAIIKRNEKSSCVKEDGRSRFVEQARRWSLLAIPLDLKEFSYTLVRDKIEQENSNETEFLVHASCRINFRNRIDTLKSKYGERHSGEMGMQNSEETASSKKRSTRSTSATIETLEKKCFICNEQRVTDSMPYNEGGLQRCSSEETAEKLVSRKNIFLKREKGKFFYSAERLELQLSGGAHDVFAADIYFHQSCYIRFVLKPVGDDAGKIENESREKDVLELFNTQVRLKILHDKNAYLLNELLQDLSTISSENNLSKPAIEHTCSLKRHLVKCFPEEIGFFPNGRHVIVHPIDINPCLYSVAALEGCGLRDIDLVKAFGKLVRRKLQKYKKESEWPLSPDELIAMLDKGPLPELFNAIYFSCYEHGKINDYGYAETSYNIATKIWAIASDWQSLVTKEKTAKRVILGLVLHRITGSKEAINLLSKSNHVISYNDIRMQNSAWSRMVSNSRMYFPHFRKGLVTHSTIDNNDGRQETWSGRGTTHDTNKTLFQIPSTFEKHTIPPIGEQFSVSPNCIDTATDDPVPYSPGKRLGPPTFEKMEIDIGKDLIYESLRQDIAWSLAGSLKEPDLPLIGSWTPFNKSVSNVMHEKMVQEFLPVTPHPPEYPVCKEYLDSLLEIIQELEIPFMFVHSDEQVYARLCDILWKESNAYSQIILLMGGFHQLRVMQRILYKRYFCKGFIDWCIDSGTIAKGSAEQAFEGRHYYRCMRVHKECFDCLVQFKAETITGNQGEFDSGLKKSLVNLRKNPTASTLSQLLQLKEFDDIVEQILSCEKHSDGEMTVSYLKDVSLMLSMVSAVRESNFLKHLQAEQNVISLSFAYDHQNYARYNSYQNIYLLSLEKGNKRAFDHLKTNGMGGSITGESFSAIHGDLITELFNKETKKTAGPFRCGFSTDINAVNTWVNTIHIHSMLRQSLHRSLRLQTSSQHKEMTPRGRKRHDENVNNLKTKLSTYKTDPFSSEPPKHITTGKKIEERVVSDFFKATDLGKMQFTAFVEDRLFNNRVGFFSPIKRNKLNSGIKIVPKAPKAVEILKEDCQAFGLIVSKAITLDDAFKYPITSVPLAIANPDGELRQSEKASFRNYLLEQSNAVQSVIPKQCGWLFDGMATIQSLRSKATYGEWIKYLLKAITPPNNADPKFIGMVNDTYNSISVKNGTREKRGENYQTTYVKGVGQHMPQGVKWNEFLRNGNNKNQLVALIVEHVVNEAGSLGKFIITERNKIHVLHNDQHSELEHNHEEADTCLVLIAIKEMTDVVIVSKDTDVLILLIWAYCYCNIKYKWFLKIDTNKYADIEKITDHFGRNICLRLPAFHSITGCDTTSYFYKTGKVRVFKKLVNNQVSLSLLDSLGEDKILSKPNVEQLKEFIQTVIYNGKVNENYVNTRVRLYKDLKKKSSMPLPPDEDSVVHAIKRAHLQCYTWLRSNELMVEHLDIQKFGWQVVENSVLPIWFTGPQLPPFQEKENPVRCAGNVADDEKSDDDVVKPPKKKKKIERKKDLLVTEIDRCDNDGDDENETADDVKMPGLVPDYISESEWEVSDFLSSDDSCDEWLP